MWENQIQLDLLKKQSSHGILYSLFKDESRIIKFSYSAAWLQSMRNRKATFCDCLFTEFDVAYFILCL